MPMDVAVWIVRAAGAYLAVGVAVAIAFVVAGVGRVDPSARGSTLGFRAIVLPGLALLWPWTLAIWARRRGTSS